MIECIQRLITNIVERVGTQGAAYGVTTFLYDSFGSLTNETVVGVAGTNTIERFWDDFGRTAGYALNGIRQTTIGYEPDKGRISTMGIENIHSTTTTNHYNSFSWTYLPGSDLKSSLVYPNGLTALWQYDANSQLLQVCNATPTNVISQYDYTYDPAGRRVAIGRSGSAMSETRTDEYGYNIRGELISAAKNAEDAKVIEYQYAYDDIGNRISSYDIGTNRTYTANNLNQYTSISNSALFASPREEFTPQFDDDGNQTLIKTASGIWQVHYNGENRPILWQCVSTNSITPNSSTPTLITMSFDRMGRRVTKNNQRFVYNGYLQIANFELQTSNIKLQTFIWDPTEPVATRPLAWRPREGSTTLNFEPSDLNFYTHDGNKNVSEVVALSNEVLAHYEYAPLGELVLYAGDCALLNPWRFSSEYIDDESVVVYYNYRHYIPVISNWLNRDILSENGGLNLYSMARNCCVSRFDILGLCCCGDCEIRNFDTKGPMLLGFRIHSMAGIDYGEISIRMLLESIGENYIDALVKTKGGAVLSELIEQVKKVNVGEKLASLVISELGHVMEVQLQIGVVYSYQRRDCKKKYWFSKRCIWSRWKNVNGIESEWKSAPKADSNNPIENHFAIEQLITDPDGVVDLFKKSIEKIIDKELDEEDDFNSENVPEISKCKVVEY